ncbi:MAG TPA: glutamate formimidoyltransferase [Anaerolineales bacterium]|jgi:glutamate formiminotransferase/formiminotetrahydrofolate cyclodeaminase
MNPIVECIPNFSEARRPEVVKQIVAAAASVPGVSILDQSSDTDHNRTVLTFAGSPAAVEEAAFRAIQKAAGLIDMNLHTGEHPRIGATDVVPFVPIAGVSMAECVEMARRLGQRVGAELNIPVYLYEAAATRPERTNLEVLRRGQYEGLKVEVETDPQRKPDFGPALLGPAGATVIGARAPLVAFNVYLTSEDVSIAKSIAKAVRQSSGGFRFVKAAGFLVDGRAQVSMNLTDYRQTPIARVVETIRREAMRYGVVLHHTELVGLIPQEALIDAAVWYTQLDQFTPEQVLETRLVASATGENGEATAKADSGDFLERLAAATPVPGGGSAAAYAGAMGASLVSMVAGLTIGKKKYSGVEERMKSILAEAETLRLDLGAAVVEDAAAFEAVMAAFKLPKETPEQEQLRAGEIEKTTLNAAHVPLEAARKSLRVIELASQVVSGGNMNAISDGASGAAMARAALTAAGTNVRINVHSLSDKSKGQPLLDDLKELELRAAQFEAEIRLMLETRAGFSF